MIRSSTLAAWRSRLRFLVVVAGWPGAAGLALALAAGTVQFVLVPQERAAAAAAREAAEQRHRAYLQAAEGGSGEKGAPPDAGLALARFHEMLTAEADADGALETIQRDARSHGLAPAASAYKWQRQPAADLAQVQITLPVKGGYGPLRGFLKDVMADVPGLALDQFDLQRDNVAAATADARLRFTLFLRRGS